MKRIVIYIFLITLFSCKEKQVEMLQNGVIIRIQDAKENNVKTIRLLVVSDKIIYVSAGTENKISDIKV